MITINSFKQHIALIYCGLYSSKGFLPFFYIMADDNLEKKKNELKSFSLQNN